ncbi:hypothetical protein VTN77DRAFT_7368 [Rasamsonia byssochlamydoides]|uniref:uncharacterized protein n=1 Tax=Rasamsonia byssochlamydoides TaxID=89139 RepID=UPI003742EC03
MEALIIGTNEEDFRAVTAISVDIQFGAMAVHYADRPSRVIGTKQSAMKTLSINGRAGERIVSAHVVVEHITVCIRLVTNFKRQIVVGHPRKFPPHETFHEAREGYTLTGFYCHWSGRGTPRTRLETFAIMSAPLEAPWAPGLGKKDENGFPWEPEPPPTSWAEFGELYGRYERADSQVRRRGAIAAWLDCSRSVDRVETVFAHPSRNSWMSLVALGLVYTDGTKKTVGPDYFGAPADAEGPNGTPWCWCNLEPPIAGRDLGRTPHYRREEWSVGFRRLDCIRIWGEGSMEGFQFVASDGAESPRWGICNGDATGIIVFGRRSADLQSPGPVTGLKVILDSNMRPVTYPDTVVVGFQALVATK